MLLGIPVYLALTRFAAKGGLRHAAARRERRLAGDLGDQLLRHPVVAPAAADRRRPRQLDHEPGYLPWWVAAATHLVFGWTIALLYPLGEYTPYRKATAPAA